MSFTSLCIFTCAYPVSFLSKCHAKNRKEVLAVRTSYRKEVLALLTCSRKEVLAVSRTQAQATHNQPQEELLLAGAKRSSCACVIFGLYCLAYLMNSVSHFPHFLKLMLFIIRSSNFNFCLILKIIQCTLNSLTSLVLRELLLIQVTHRGHKS